MTWSRSSAWLAVLLLMPIWPASVWADVAIVTDGEARAAICVPPEIMQTEEEELAQQHERLRESVKDLAHYLEKISGTPIETITGSLGAGDERVPILIGDMAVARFGPPKTHAPAEQGFRVVVTPEAVGLMGESDLATSYAVYELLHQLGCRWYMPSEMGEVIPRRDTVALPEQDLDSAPYTLMRSIWYADEDYRRRNRLGGLGLQTGHALEGYVSEELLREHPDWLAVSTDGQHRGRRLKFSKPGVAAAIADSIIQILDENPRRQSISLSPDDGPATGVGFDTTDDAKLDAGDWDPTIPGVSHTDRLVWLCNRIAERVTEKHPHVIFGMLAYRNYNRPPVREKLHPSIVPQIAPLSYSRAHPWTDDGEPNNETMRYIVSGWAQAADKVSYYMYGYFWPELSTPNPFITKWSINVPMALTEGACRFWQPETLPNFDTTLHGLYLGIRLAWDPNQNPETIIDELHGKFYGHAGGQMAAYWEHVDRCWVGTPEYSGGGYGHLRRFTPERMDTARRLMDEAIAAAHTPKEKFRVEMADQSLRLFELFMKMRRDLSAGRFESLASDADRWRDRASSLADEYQPQFAFGRSPWDEGNSVYGRLFRKLYQDTYQDASRIARDYVILTETPLRSWRYRLDPQNEGEAAGWSDPGFDDGDWEFTDPCLETMSTLGHHDHRGALWYRAKVRLPKIPTGKKVYLWIGGAFDYAQPFFNGEPFSQFRSRGNPKSFDITDLVRPDAENQIAILCVRAKGRLGLGGLVAPCVIYQENPR